MFGRIINTSLKWPNPKPKSKIKTLGTCLYCCIEQIFINRLINVWIFFQFIDWKFKWELTFLKLYPQIKEFKIASHCITFLSVVYCRRVTRGGREGGGLPCPFSKIGKRCPNLGKKCPDCGHLWWDFSFKMQFLRVSRQQNR